MDGLMKDFKGSVHLDGADVRKLFAKEIYRKSASVFQNPDEQLLHQRIRDVSFGPLNMGSRGRRRVARRVRGALRDVEMEEYGEIDPQPQFRPEEEICIAGLLGIWLVGKYGLVGHLPWDPKDQEFRRSTHGEIPDDGIC